MKQGNPSIKDFDSLMAKHAARTALLRARHPINRPALDDCERDSEIRCAMGACAIVFVGLVVSFASLLIRVSA